MPFVAKKESCCRYNILKQMEQTDDHSILIISSCQTIGEGVDTKDANMVVFVDAKSSITAITQNIGRIVRKLFGVNKRKSTILLPCWVNKDNYTNIDDDDEHFAEKRDAVIRESMGKSGDFNSILNVMSAIRQDSQEMHIIPEKEDLSNF